MIILGFARFHAIRVVLGLAAVVLGFGLALPVFGQGRPSIRKPPPSDQPTTVPVKLEGAIVSIASGRIVISAHVPPSEEHQGQA